MAYRYDEKSKKVVTVEPPKVTGEDAKRILRAKPPKKLLKAVAAMKFNISK